LSRLCSRRCNLLAVSLSRFDFSISKVGGIRYQYPAKIDFAFYNKKNKRSLQFGRATLPKNAPSGASACWYNTKPFISVMLTIGAIIMITKKTAAIDAAGVFICIMFILLTVLFIRMSLKKGNLGKKTIENF